jgi:predicted GNAT family N-acyltransferase
MQFQRIEFESNVYFQMLALRYDILRKPLGLHFSATDLLPDKNSIHFVGVKNKQVLVCLILSPKNDGNALDLNASATKVYKMRQVAVQSKFQGQGIGKKLVQFVEIEAKKMGITHFELNARKSAVPFYLTMNYSLEGEEFEEVGIPHFTMKKVL